VLQVIRALSPQTTVSVMARYPFQVEQATRMGAASILYPQDSYDGVVRATGARLYAGMLGNKMLLGGYDAVYDTIGTQKTLADARRWTRAGGEIVLVGVDLQLKYLDLSPVWYQEVSVTGSMGHGMENWPMGTGQHRSTFTVAAELIEHGLLHPEKLLTHRFALTNFREAIRAAKSKGETRAIKVVFDYALLPASVVPNVRCHLRG
jgi:threonine dehydrogenase-like Zn-dependent dehydrogenase